MEQKATTETKPAGYKVVNVLLLESSFTRVLDVDIQIIHDIDNKIQVEPEAHESTPDQKFAVTLSIKYEGIQNEKNICSASIKMLGIFEKYGEPSLDEEKFKLINAPAIIYPFIREHLYNICLRAGIANVLLPTVNFKP